MCFNVNISCFFCLHSHSGMKLTKNMTMNENYVIGIDLGGTNTVIGLVDAKGHILAKDDSIKTQAHPDIEEYTDSIAAVIKKLAEEHGCTGKLEGVGVGNVLARIRRGISQTVIYTANLRRVDCNCP